MPIANPTSIAIIFDTTSYSGNFEHELCTYLTGHVEASGRGDKISITGQNNIKHLQWWKEHIALEPDEYGTLHAASIWITPGWFNNGFGQHFIDDPSNYEAARSAAVEYFTKYAADHETNLRQRLANNDFERDDKPGAWTKDAILRTISDNASTIRKLSAETKHHPAYLSVAVFVDERPNEHVMGELITRAEYFCQNYKEFNKFATGPIELTGVRHFEPKHSTAAHP